MNKNGGLFALSIGAMAKALLSVAVFSAQAMLWEEESEDYLAVMGDVKMAWANTAVVFDTLVGDVVNDCKCAAINQARIDENVNKAMNSMFPAGTAGVGCSALNKTYSIAGNNVSYSVTIDCLQQILAGGIDKFKARFSKNITFSKTCS